MSSSLYLLFKNEAAPIVRWQVSLPRAVQGLSIVGYSFFDAPLKRFIEAPDERRSPVRCSFYAQNYFRIFISNLAVEFYRETDLPSDLISGERHLALAIFAIPKLRLRRWVSTEEGYSDDDERYVRILAEGTDKDTVPL
jgi:hypothetical protein